MNKKGETGDSAYDVARKSVYWMIAGVMLTMAVLLYVYFLSGMNARLTYVPEKLRAEVISLRFANLPECFAYQDPDTGRVYPGVIDTTKFNFENTNNCYKTDDNLGYGEYNFRFLLKNKRLEVYTNNYFHGEFFSISRTVLIKEGNTITSDEMIIYVQSKLFSHPTVAAVS
ncbi:MAG: hypothetical protein V2A62_05600 [Candidatus Woesearchaeota archaeon]